MKISNSKYNIFLLFFSYYHNFHQLYHQKLLCKRLFLNILFFDFFENRNVLTNNSSCDEWIRLFRLNKTRLISLGLEILSKCLKLVLNHVIILEEIESKSWVTIIYKIRWREYRNYNICFESFLKRIWTVINPHAVGEVEKLFRDRTGG